MSVQSYKTHNHDWSFDDKGGDRSLPDGPATCAHCRLTFAQYSAVPRPCEGRPVFTPKAETAPESMPGALKGKSQDTHQHNGHSWPKPTGGVPVKGEPCSRCGAQYGTPEAVWTCSGSPGKAPDVKTGAEKLLETPKALPSDQLRQFTDAEAWSMFASARLYRADRWDDATVADTAACADAMLAELKKRFPGT